MRFTRIAMQLIALALAIGPRPAAAQDYPSRPVRIVVPFAPGAGNDLLGRIVATELTKRLGGQVFVENKPGAASQLGTVYLNRAFTVSRGEYGEVGALMIAAALIGLALPLVTIAGVRLLGLRTA